MFLSCFGFEALNTYADVAITGFDLPPGFELSTGILKELINKAIITGAAKLIEYGMAMGPAVGCLPGSDYVKKLITDAAIRASEEIRRHIPDLALTFTPIELLAPQLTEE